MLRALSPLLASAHPWAPEFWLEKAGRAAPLMVAAILFAESGLFFGFFLPGDSLLFLAGFFSSSGAQAYVANGQGGAAALQPVVDGMHAVPFLGVLALFFLSAVLGDQVGYWFGKWVGPNLFRKEDSRLFRRSHVLRATTFLDTYGPKTILLARFVPIVRTFAPIVAGTGRMRYRTFITYNLIGGAVWALGVTTLGFYLGNVSFVRDHIETAIIGVVAISLLPIVFEVVKKRREQRLATTI